VAYPAAFRRAYGAQMLQVFRDRCRQATQAHGRPGLLALWLPTLADLFRTALAEWLATTRPLSRPFLIRLCGLLMLGSASLPLLLVLYVLVRSLFGTHLHLLAPGLMPFAEGGVAAVLPLYPVWGLFGLLLCQRTWLGWLGGSLALLGQLLPFWWNAPLYTWSFALDASGGTEYVSLTPSILGLVVVPLGLLLCGLAVWRARMLGSWSVMGLLLFLATGLQGLLILWEWGSVFIAPSFTWASGLSVFLIPLGLGIFSWPLWAGLGYALWVRRGTPMAGPEPLAPSSLS
jgi:hypothetical protein